MLSRPLRQALAETLAAGRQAILFLNRRGFAGRVYCFACGFALRCKHCDVSLVYHASDGPRRVRDPLEGELRCHYCGYREDPMEACPNCGSPEGGMQGFGTERLFEEVVATYPGARIGRLDRDTSARKGAQRAILAAFHRGELDVLVGTQMVAKGHDVPGVTLVGVIAADLGLHFPDFRAGERTFQLLTQVAGRAGRGDEPGPGRDPDLPAAALRDRARADARLPALLPRGDRAAPRRTAGRRSASSCSSPSPGGARPRSSRGGTRWRAWRRPCSLDDLDGAAVEVLGPAPAPLSRIRDEFRWQLLLARQPRSRCGASRPSSRARRAGPGFAGVSLRLDASPLQML